MDVVVIVAEFKRMLKIRGYSPKTIESYSWGLDEFKTWLLGREITDLKRVTDKVLSEYKHKVMSEPLAAESKAVKLRPVKRLFEYLTGNHRLLINPAEGLVEICRKHRKVGTVLTVKEIKRLFDQPNLSLRIHIRDRAIMEVLYSTAIRADELVNLKVYDADLKDRVLCVRKAKGKRQRVVPLGKPAIRFLREYLEKIRPRYARKNPKCRALFLANTGAALTTAAVRLFLRRYRESAGIKKPVTPHTLRRTCATHMLEQGADVRYIQKLLGHERLSTTQTYTKVLAVHVKKTHNASHPGVKK
jgi:integrase/recombinase XerD